MATTRDMTAPNWKRTVKRLRRLAKEFESRGCRIIWPDDFDTPPDRRIANTSPPLP